MKPAIHIPQSEQGTIRVFAISRPVADMARALDHLGKAALAADLLGHHVADTAVEVFALDDLAGVGLARYLADGYDVDPQSLSHDRTRLEALDGYVLLVFSSVSDARDVELTPVADLTLIGTYHEPKAARSAAPIATSAARPYSGTKAQMEPAPRGRAGSVLPAAGVALGILIIWWMMR